MTGQIAGFFSGLFKDFLSPAPLGMNCLIRTLIGALTGIFKGNFFLDVILLPVILCTATTVGKVLITFLLHLIMGSNVPVQMYSLLSNVLWIELGLNAFFAPLLFLLLKKFKFLLVTRR
jgi:rod shape-determining protein MreD